MSHDLWQRRTWTELALTATALGLIQPFNIAGGLADAQAFDRRWGTQVAQRQLDILAAVAKLAKDIPRWTPRQWGRAVGRLVGDVLLAKGAGAAVKVAVRVSVTATRVASANVVGWELGAMTSRQAAKTVAQKLPTILTDAEGYLIGPVRFNAPINLRVQRFGLMSLRKLDYWGPRTFGSSQTAARRFNAILPNLERLDPLHGRRDCKRHKLEVRHHRKPGLALSRRTLPSGSRIPKRSTTNQQSPTQRKMIVSPYHFLDAALPDGRRVIFTETRELGQGGPLIGFLSIGGGQVTDGEKVAEFGGPFLVHEGFVIAPLLTGFEFQLARIDSRTGRIVSKSALREKRFLISHVFGNNVFYYTDLENKNQKEYIF